MSHARRRTLTKRAAGSSRYEVVTARDQRVARVFKRKRQVANLIISVAKIVTR
jgi:hypothetical protein